MTTAWTAPPCTAWTWPWCPQRWRRSSSGGWSARRPPPVGRTGTLAPIPGSGPDVFGDVFGEAVRLTYLDVCADLWPGHVALLRDSVASQLLSGHSHKSAVAAYIRRSAEAWARFLEMVEAGFLSRLATMSLHAGGVPPVAVSEETKRLLALETFSPG